MKQLQRLPIFSPDTSPELRTWQWLALIGGSVAFFLPVDGIEYSICFFYNLTGLPCPGCGMSRATHYALHLEPLHAFYHHPGGLLAALTIVFFLLTAIWRPAGALFERVKHHTATALFAVALAMVGFGLLRGIAFAYGPLWGWTLPSGFQVVLSDRIAADGAQAIWRMLFGFQ
ncbi:MAG: DUF2752 domain-containing protein [bacterium]|nr:DUF2752 domain-containing protein [bacterium]